MGSNPTGVIFSAPERLVAAADCKRYAVPGLLPTAYTYYSRSSVSVTPFSFHVGVRASLGCLSRWALAQVLVISKRGDGMARLAQSVERKAHNLVVVGSSPTVGVCWSHSTKA